MSAHTVIQGFGAPFNASSMTPAAAPRNVGLFGRIANAWRRARTINELNALDEKSLADIGLRRADIPHIFETDYVRELARGRR